MGLSTAELHYELMCPVAIPIVFSDSSDSPLAQLPLELCKGTVKESKTPQGYGQIEVLPNCSYLDLIMQIDANNEKQENVFENDGCRAKCMFVLPTMCEMGLLL